MKSNKSSYTFINKKNTKKVKVNRYKKVCVPKLLNRYLKHKKGLTFLRHESEDNMKMEKKCLKFSFVWDVLKNLHYFVIKLSYK